ncbi:MAG: SpoIIE family protein phosphatase [Bacteroidales bacterium]|nr:SpoIIE family protein phosphatase [Candidatus Sodaliphilus fimicaballi]
MNKILGIRNLINISLAVMLIGGIVFASGFGICLYLAQQEVSREADMKIETNIDYIQSYVDGQLQRVEDAAYTLLSTRFGNAVRENDSTARVVIDYDTFKRPSPQEIFMMLNKFLDVNPQACGIAVGLESEVYSTPDQPNGFAAYVTNVGGQKEQLSLGAIHNFREKAWYRNAKVAGKAMWSNPFRETSHGKVVTCYSIPLLDNNNNLLGVLAIDIDTEAFRNKCNAVSPFPNSVVTMTDRNFRFVAHPDTSLLLMNVEQVARYDTSDFNDSVKGMMLAHKSGHHTMRNSQGDDILFYFTSIKRSGWTIAIECPEASVFGNIDRMRRDTIFIALVSILIMIVCFVWLFRRLQGVALSKAGMERELEIASGIQRGMLPDSSTPFPQRDDLDVCGYINPAKSVGGDLYDYFIRDNRLYFCIGDVSGKGVPASLFMAVVHTLFRNLSLHDDNPASIMSSMNEALCRGNKHNMFCTMYMGVLNLSTGNLLYCNAGHCAPILRHGENLATLDVSINIALGVIEGFPYKGQEINLSTGDAVFLYTDGVTEAENETKELYGDKQVISALRYAFMKAHQTASGVIDAMVNSISRHVGEAVQSDDITMLMISYSGPSNHALRIVNDVNEVTKLTPWLETVIADYKIPQDKAFNLNLAIEEAVVNVISYAYDNKEQPINIAATREGKDLVVTITDNGKAFDPTKAERPNLNLPVEERPIGGLGIMLVNKIASKVEYRRENESNKLSLYFNIK